MTDNQTILQQMQTAVTYINFTHPDTAITGLQGVLERLDPKSSDAARLQRAIDRLEEIAGKMADIERWTFGQLEEVEQRR